MHSSREAVSTKKGWAHGKGAVQETLARTVTRKKSGVMLWETDPLALLSKSGVGMAEATRTIPWSILALHLCSVCLPNDALHSLKCHPLTCKLLDSRLCADSTRTRFRQFVFILPDALRPIAK